MIEETASAIPSSIWESMNSWLTPTVLFVLLNVMIGTIAFTSTLTHQNQHQQTKPNTNGKDNEPMIVRSPSVLQRLKSINLPTRSQFFTSAPDTPNQDFDVHPLQSHYFFPETAPQLEVHYIFNQPHEHTTTPEEIKTHFAFEQTDSGGFDFQQGVEDLVEDNVPPQSLEEVYSQLESHFSRTKSDTVPSAGEIPVKLSAKIKKSASSKSAFGHFEEADIVESRRPANVRERSISKVTDSDEEVDAKADDFINKFKQQLKVQRLDSITRYKDMIARGVEIGGGKY